MVRERLRWWKLSLFLLGMVGVVVVMHAMGLHWSHLSPQRVRSYILSFGWWAPAVYMLAYAQPVVPLPASAMCMAGGLSFGLLGGAASALIAATLRGCGQFLIARGLGREAVASILRGRVAALDQHIGERGFQTVFWLRIIPNVPYDLQNFSLGFSRISLGAFALATFLGIIPGTLLWVYLGHTLTDARQLWKIAAALLSVSVLYWYVQHRVRSPQAPASS